MARFFLRRFPQLDPRDLVQDTALRFVAMERKWPRGEVFGAVFYNALRSVAYDYRKAAMAGPHMTQADLPPSSQGGSDTLEALLDDRRTAETALDARQFLDKVFSKFSEDPVVEAVLMGRMEGMTAKEVQAEFSMSSEAYDAARKRFERWLSGELKEGDRTRAL